MTGEKNRYSSLEKLWKLDDETLKTPKHDEMVLWLLDIENVCAVLPVVKSYYNLPTTTYRNNRTRPFSFVQGNFWEKLDAKEIVLTDDELIRAGFYMATDIVNPIERYTLKEKEIINIDNKIIEENLYNFVATEAGIVFDGSMKVLEADKSNFYMPLYTNENGYDDTLPSMIWVLHKKGCIVYLWAYSKGYSANIVYIKNVGVDAVKMRWQEMINEYHGLNTHFSPTLKIQSEIPIMTERDFLVGYWDVVISPKKEEDVQHYEYFNVLFKGNKYDAFGTVYIEVKPKIDSFGATLRQLRTYQEYEPDAVGNTYLFTGDLRFEEAFESQGIKVIDANQKRERLDV